MESGFLVKSNKDFFPEPEENIMESIFKQYERVIIESIITSFGLDFIVKDQHGGDVDTINNVRKIGIDANMTYKNKTNKSNYENKGEYNSSEYHSHKQYKEKNKQVKNDKENGKLYDAYTGNKIKRNEKSDLDHTISAKEIHEDRGRVLANLNGADLANSKENLNATNPHTNRTKKADSMNEHLDKYGENYTEEQKNTMRKKDAEARKAYEAKLAKAYYTSSGFAKDLTSAATKRGVEMGIRQALGFVFTEIWFVVKEEFKNMKGKFKLGEFLKLIGNSIKRGVENAKKKYKELFEKFKEGAFSGILASLTTTISNIFFTTAKNVVKVVRQSWASLVQAAKVLFINPENYTFGERIRSVLKIVATGASVVAGTLVTEAIDKIPTMKNTFWGDIIKTFAGSFVTGILSCTLLYFFDRSTIVNKLVNSLNGIHTIDNDINYFYKQAEYFEQYAAELLKIDIDKFKKETLMYSNIALELEMITDEDELNRSLIKILDTIGVKIPWKGDFDTFMKDKSQRLVFE